MPMNPAILQMLASLGGPGGPGGPGGGMPPGMMGPGGGGPPPGMNAGPPPPGPPSPMDDMGQEGMDALGKLTNGEPNGALRMEQVTKGLEIVHKILLASLPIVGSENMDLSKQLAVLTRQIADTRMNLNKESAAGVPPEAMIGGIRGTGVPGRF